MDKYQNQNFEIQRNFIHPEKISEILSCCICDEVFNNPMRLDCGHTFCYICLENWLKRNEQCPNCRTTIIYTLISRDLLAYNIIMSLEVCCNNAKIGCPWKGKLFDLNNHMKVCNENISIIQNLEKSSNKSEKKNRRTMFTFQSEKINKDKFLDYKFIYSDSKKNDDISKDNIEILKKIFSK